MPFDWASLLATVGPIAAKAAQGAAAGRQTQTVDNQSQDSLRNQQYGTQQGAEMSAGNLDLARKAFEEQARGSRSHQAMLGDLLSNFQPTNVSVPGIKNATVTGGLAASMGPMSKAAGAELSRQAMLKLMEGDQFSGGNVMTPPTLTPMPKAGALETGLGAAGTGASLLAGIMAALQKKNGAMGNGGGDFGGET